MILLHCTHCDQFTTPSSRLARFWIFRLVKRVNLKTKGSNSDTLQLSNSIESRFALGVSSKGISLLSHVLSFLRRIYINSQINLFSKLRSCPQPAQSSQITWATPFAWEDTSDISIWYSFTDIIWWEKHHYLENTWCTSYEEITKSISKHHLNHIQGTIRPRKDKGWWKMTQSLQPYFFHHMWLPLWFTISDL